MKKIRITLFVLIILASSLSTVGCWNYREIDKLAIVTGVAIDKGEDSPYKITVETIKISGGKDAKTSAETITMEGKTIFDAVRNGISLSGKRFYWSHAKVIIISKEIASKGISDILDWYSRDSETRPDVHILISGEASAKEILDSQGTTEEIKSFELDEMIKNQKSLSKAPEIDVLQFANDLQGKGIAAIAPTVTLKQTDSKISPQIMGTAIFKLDKLIGFLNGEETKYLMLIKNKVKSGVLTEVSIENDIATPVSLEIFNSKTQVKPIINSEAIKINLNVDMTVAIDEIGGTENLIDDKGRLRLEQSAEKTLKNQISSLIKKIQSEYGVDIFGFGAKLREDNNYVWNAVSSNWGETFRSLEVDVKTKIHIKNSAVLSKPIEESD